VHSLRTVLGIVGIGLLRGLAWLLRFIGSIMRFLAKMLVNAYDFVIFAPLWVERKLKNKDVSDSERLDSATTTL
jgi:hypothetical protein